MSPALIPDEGKTANEASEHNNGERACASGDASPNIAADDLLRVEAAQVDRIGRYEPKLSENGIPKDGGCGTILRRLGSQT